MRNVRLSLNFNFFVIKPNLERSNFQNHLKNLIQRVVGIRNEVKTANDNIVMLKVKIEAVQTDINNFHLKNLKNIKAQGGFLLTVKRISAIMIKIDIATQKRKRRLN